MTLGPLAATGGTVAGITIAYHLARNIIANEAFYRTLFATSPLAGEGLRERGKAAFAAQETYSRRLFWKSG